MPQTVPIEPPEVFVDSGGFIALYNPADTHHQTAIACRDLTLQYAHMFTSAAVIAETMGHFQRDNQIDQTIVTRFATDLLNPIPWIIKLPIDEEILREGLEKVRAVQNPRFSIVDATNIVLMEKNRIDLIFTFDAMYDGISVMRGYETRFLRRVCV